MFESPTSPPCSTLKNLSSKDPQQTVDCCVDRVRTVCLSQTDLTGNVKIRMDDSSFLVFIEELQWVMTSKFDFGAP